MKSLSHVNSDSFHIVAVTTDSPRLGKVVGFTVFLNDLSDHTVLPASLSGT
jgi:hypothetical protein